MQPRHHFILSIYGKALWLPILAAGAVILFTLGIIATHDPHAAVLAWSLYVVFAILTFAFLAFFRDFPRHIPDDSNIMVAPADGKVTEITHIENYEPLGGPAIRIGIFLSVLDVHVNRAPCDALVLKTEFREGLFLDARHPESGLRNQSFTITLGDPQTKKAIAIVRQVVGAIARRIITPVTPSDTWQRGQRFGMIAFGSRTELYLPAKDWQAAIKINDHVKGASTIIARNHERK